MRLRKIGYTFDLCEFLTKWPSSNPWLPFHFFFFYFSWIIFTFVEKKKVKRSFRDKKSKTIWTRTISLAKYKNLGVQ